jgi:hypothetical protein
MTATTADYFTFAEPRRDTVAEEREHENRKHREASRILEQWFKAQIEASQTQEQRQQIQKDRALIVARLARIPESIPADKVTDYAKLTLEWRDLNTGKTPEWSGLRRVQIGVEMQRIRYPHLSNSLE